MLLVISYGCYLLLLVFHVITVVIAVSQNVFLRQIHLILVEQSIFVVCYAFC